MTMTATINYRKVAQLINRLRTPSYSRTKSITYFGDNAALIVHYLKGVNANGDHETEIFFATGDETLNPKAEESVTLDTRHADISGKDRQYTDFLNGIHLLKPCLHALDLESGAYTNGGYAQWYVRTGPLPAETIIIPCTPMSLIKVIQAIQQKEAKQKGTAYQDIFNNPKNIIITAGKGFMKVNVIQNDAA